MLETIEGLDVERLLSPAAQGVDMPPPSAAGNDYAYGQTSAAGNDSRDNAGEFPDGADAFDDDDDDFDAGDRSDPFEDAGAATPATQVRVRLQTRGGRAVKNWWEN